MVGGVMTQHAPLSSRITQINGGGSDGWDHFRRARAMKESGAPVIELTIGEHDIRTAAPILQDMHRAAKAGHTGYADIPGIPILRETVARRMAENTGVPTTPDNILITPGGQFGLFAAHLAACDEGDRALYIDPYYATYPGTIRSVGAVPVPVQAKPEFGFQPQIRDLEAAVEGARSLMINSPNNPTGAVYSPATMDGIAGLCQAHDLWLISDEVYDTQVWDGEHITPRALPGMLERTLVVGSLSKSHAMTGSRIGWVCGPEPVIACLEDLTTHSTYGLPGYIQEAAVFALNQGPAFEADIADPFKRRRQITMELLAGQNAVKASPSQGAMYALLDIRATGLSGEDYAARLLDDELIAVMPGESFGAAAAGHVRVAFTIEDAVFRDAMTRLLAHAGALST